MSLVVEDRDEFRDEGVLAYRALSPVAVVSLVLGLLSFAAFFSFAMLVVPALGVLAGLYAWARIRRYPQELTGAGLAKAGIGLSLLLAAVGAGRLSYVYATEVPPGYDRADYSQLQPDPSVPSEVIPASARALDGRRIFIKGFVYPSEFDQDAKGIRKFVLCRDNGQCCFGGQPKMTDMILVTLKDPLRLEYSPRMHRVAGTFKVETVPGNQLGGIVYQMDADYLK